MDENQQQSKENKSADEVPLESVNGKKTLKNDADCSFNGCQKYFYEKLADTVLYCTPGYTSFPKDGISSEKNENLNAFFNQYKRRFFERRSLKRPVYTLKLDQEGKIVRDKNGILVVLVNSYVQGELKTTKQLLYREAVDGVLSSLHYIKGVLGEDTCLPGGVNALSRLFNQKYVFKGIFNLIRAFLARCSTCQVNNPLPMRVLPPPVPIRSFRPHSRLQCDLIDMAPKKHRSFMQNNCWSYRYILTVKCCFSKFCWLFPLKTKSAEEVYAVLKALFIKEGSPTVIQSDNGGEFIGEVVQKLCKEFEVCMVHGRPHHPQSQGQIENLNKQVKRLLARFLQQLPRDLQANVWPLLLSAIADLLNCKWHSTINDVPFRIYKNREPSCLVDYIIPDDSMWTESIEDGCLEDYEFSSEDFIELERHGESTSMDKSKLEEITEAILQISSETILLSSLGVSAKQLSAAVKKIVQGNSHSPPSHSHNNIPLQSVDSEAEFQVESITKYLFNLSEEYKSKLVDVLEATEHTIQKNHKRALKRAKEREFKVGDKVLFQNPRSEGLHFSKPDPFQPLNVLGVIKEVRPGGMFKVEIECGEQLVVKSIFGGQMVLFKEKQCELPLCETPPKLSLLNMHNFISEFGLTVRKEMYNRSLRLRKVAHHRSIDDLLKSYCQVLDYGLLAMVSSFSDREEEEAVFHQKFVTGLQTLQASGFQYFLYGTIFWERDRKQNLGKSILSHLTSYEEHSDCLSCVGEQKETPCFHPCCQNLVLQMAVNCGLFCVTIDGCIVPSDDSIMKTSQTAPKETPLLSSHTTEASTSCHDKDSIKRPSTQVGVDEPVFNKDDLLDHTNDVNVDVGSNRCSTPQGSLKTHEVTLGEPSTSLLFMPGSNQGMLWKPAELKDKCQQHLENIDPYCSELAKFVMPLKGFLAAINPSQDNATERSNLRYFLKIIDKHANKDVQSQVRLSSNNGSQECMQVQGYSSFCGLCAMNNAIGCSRKGPTMFNLFDLDLAADIIWLKQVCEVGCGFSVPLEPMRGLDGDYSILAMEEAAIRKNCTFQRLDLPLRALVDGAAINSLDTSSLQEFYSLLLGLFQADERPSLILRTKEYHFVTLLFKADAIVLLDSRRTSALPLSLKDGLGYIQREAYQNPDFAAVNLQGPGTYGNPVRVNDLPEVKLHTNFHCTLDEVWDLSSTVSDDTIIATLHGQVKAKDVRTLKPGNQINDVVINYIGPFLMSQKKDVYVASTFWLNHCSQELGVKEMLRCDFHKYEKFVFPVHCPGHWWCVLIDRPMKLYGEFDSLCKDRRSDYVFQVLCREFKTANIDISSFRRLSQEEREKLPSQGQNVFDCGVFVLGFISAFVNNLEMNFSLRDMPFLRNSFAKIIMNGQPVCDIKNCPSTQESCHPACEEGGHGSVLGLVGCSTIETMRCRGQENICSDKESGVSGTGLIHCAGENSSARIGEDGIKKCRTGVSPFSPDKTMEEVSVGFGVAFPGKYELGDFEKDYEDMEDDPFVVPPPLLPLDIQLRDKDTELSNENNIQASEPDDEDLVLYELLKPPYDASHELPTLQMLYSKEERKVFQGLNPITEQYLFKLRKEKGINVPRGCYHAVMTTEEMVDFDYWRQVRKGKSRQRFFHYRWDRAFEVWTKETTEELIDVASILERVDSDGWVLLNITEQYHYEMWRDWKWRQLEEKDLL